MSARRLVAVVALLTGLATACSEPEPQPVSFPVDTTMARLQQAGRITIGVKVDQPGVGFRNLVTGELEGFDIEIAKLIARRLGVKDITWVPTVSEDRVPYLQQGRVDLVIASFSITPDRRREIGQAGPYLVAGQQLLVRNDEQHIRDEHALSGARVCSVNGSTSLRTVKETYAARPIGVPTYTECVKRLLDGSVDAVTTDDAILLGYAAQQPDKLKVVGRPFTTERYGIGYRLGDLPLCRFLTETILGAQSDGGWQDAFDRTLGRAGVPRPPMPTPDPCPG